MALGYVCLEMQESLLIKNNLESNK
jgi:hypothetical protein